jgi:hypothetical protein
LKSLAIFYDQIGNTRAAMDRAAMITHSYLVIPHYLSTSPSPVFESAKGPNGNPAVHAIVRYIVGIANTGTNNQAEGSSPKAKKFKVR